MSKLNWWRMACAVFLLCAATAIAPATFTVRSPSLMSATVPADATTGTVQVVTPSGTLSSNVPFTVAP